MLILAPSLHAAPIDGPEMAIPSLLDPGEQVTCEGPTIGPPQSWSEPPPIKEDVINRVIQRCKDSTEPNFHFGQDIFEGGNENEKVLIEVRRVCGECKLLKYHHLVRSLVCNSSQADSWTPLRKIENSWAEMTSDAVKVSIATEHAGVASSAGSGNSEHFPQSDKYQQYCWPMLKESSERSLKSHQQICGVPCGDGCYDEYYWEQELKITDFAVCFKDAVMPGSASKPPSAGGEGYNPPSKTWIQQVIGRPAQDEGGGLMCQMTVEIESKKKTIYYNICDQINGVVEILDSDPTDRIDYVDLFESGDAFYKVDPVLETYPPDPSVSQGR